jgi:hypothetical protein
MEMAHARDTLGDVVKRNHSKDAKDVEHSSLWKLENSLIRERKDLKYFVLSVTHAIRDLELSSRSLTSHNIKLSKRTIEPLLVYMQSISYMIQGGKTQAEVDVDHANGIVSAGKTHDTFWLSLLEPRVSDLSVDLLEVAVGCLLFSGFDTKASQLELQGGMQEVSLVQVIVALAHSQAIKTCVRLHDRKLDTNRQHQHCKTQTLELFGSNLADRKVHAGLQTLVDGLNLSEHDIRVSCEPLWRQLCVLAGIVGEIDTEEFPFNDHKSASDCSTSPIFDVLYANFLADFMPDSGLKLAAFHEVTLSPVSKPALRCDARLLYSVPTLAKLPHSYHDLFNLTAEPGLLSCDNCNQKYDMPLMCLLFDQ